MIPPAFPPAFMGGLSGHREGAQSMDTKLREVDIHRRVNDHDRNP